MDEVIDRSNSAILLQTFPDGLRCFARPHGQAITVLVGTFAMGISLLPLTGSPRYVHRLLTGQFRGEDVIELLMTTLPFLLAGIVFVQFLRVLRRPRGVEIKEGVVILSTPDSPVARHEFQRANLGGAKLVEKVDGAVDLQILRRRGGSVVILRKYRPMDLMHAVDAINDLVVDDHHWAFEVIIPHQAAPPPQRPSKE